MRIVAKRALLPQGWVSDVSIEIGKDGLIADVHYGPSLLEKADETLRCPIVVPGMANLHSHAFQRAMAGLAERAASAEESFWSWREVMYRLAGLIEPDDLELIAVQLYAEMLEAGFTGVGEFHYIHRTQTGDDYGDPLEMSERIIAASRQAGIGLTHLPVVYVTGGFDGQPLDDGQRRFRLDPAEAAEWLAFLERRHRPSSMLRFGIAPHSLRAVTPDNLAELADIFASRPIHLHIAEQQREVEACIAWSGRRPVEWLLENVEVDERWCLVHATHLSEHETRLLAATGAVVGLCPVTEANLGDGIFPARAYGEAGGRLGIGTDSHIRVDLADELRTLEYGQRLRDLRRSRLAAPGRIRGPDLAGGSARGWRKSARPADRQARARRPGRSRGT